MGEFALVMQNLRTAFSLVPWRMRPKLILLTAGSAGVALLDMVAVVLMLPVMELVSGVPVRNSLFLRTVSETLGIEGRQPILLVVLLIIAVLMVSKSLLTLAFRWWSIGLINSAQTAATETLMDLFMTSPFESHRRRTSGEIYTNLNGYVPAAFSAVALGAVQAMTDVILVVGVLLALLFMSPVATVIALLFFGATSLGIQMVLKPRLFRLGQDHRLAELRGWRYLTPAIDGFKQARLAEVGERFTDLFIESRRDQNNVRRKIAILGEMPRYLLDVVMILGIALLSVVLLVTSGEAKTFSLLGVFAVASVRMIPSFNRLISSVGNIRANESHLQALAAQVEELRGERYRDDYREEILDFPRGDISFKNLSFAFQDAEEPILNSISGSIEEGSTVALVGSSGAGKSTFVDILAALYEPTGGEVTVGGVSIHDHPVSWRRQIGVVSQSVFLFADTMRRNIAYGLPDEKIDEERLAEAVKLAQLEDVLSEMPDGLDTQMGQQGERLSGGQRQRIGIARALYRRPRVLILDEATASLDNLTEAQFTKTIASLHGRMTIVIVAHRLSTVKDADEILFFEDGHIAGRGSMAELAESNDSFAELVRLGKLQ